MYMQASRGKNFLFFRIIFFKYLSQGLLPRGDNKEIK